MSKKDLIKEFITAVDSWVKDSSLDNMEDMEAAAYSLVAAYPKQYYGNTIRSLYKLLTGKDCIEEDK